MTSGGWGEDDVASGHRLQDGFQPFGQVMVGTQQGSIHVRDDESDPRGQGVGLGSQLAQVIRSVRVVRDTWVMERVVDGVRHDPIVPDKSTIESGRVWRCGTGPAV